jgi:phosphoenolpyruvate carboxykinase (ATP)
MISAALNGDLEGVEYTRHEIFGLRMPLSCPDVPTQILDPRQTWTDKDAYDEKAAELAQSFVKNFEKFEDKASEEILAASPNVFMKS